MNHPDLEVNAQEISQKPSDYLPQVIDLHEKVKQAQSVLRSVEEDYAQAVSNFASRLRGEFGPFVYKNYIIEVDCEWFDSKSPITIQRICDVDEIRDFTDGL